MTDPLPSATQPLKKYKCTRIMCLSKKGYEAGKINKFGFEPGGVGHGPRDQFCPITSLQMAD